MASNVIKECLVCTEEFDEDERCPRMLPCSHCLCTNCINQLIVRNDKKCPVCQKTFEAHKAQDLGRNVIAIDLLRYIKGIESNTVIKQSPRSRKELVEEMKTNSIDMNNQNTDAVTDVKDRMGNTIKRNDEIIMSIKKQRMILQNEIMRKIKDIDTQHEAKILYLEQENERIRKQMEEAEEKRIELDEVKQALDDATTLVRVDAAIDEAETSNEAVKNWLQNFKTIESRQQKILEGLQKSVSTKRKGIGSLRKILESDDMKNIDLDAQLTDMDPQEDLLRKLAARTLKEICPETRLLLDMGFIYAILDHEGKRLSAQISLSREKLLVHCLSEQHLPANICTVDHREMMKFVDPSSRLLFLDFGTNYKSLGRVFVRMNCDSKRAQNFSALCSGETGPAYRYANIYSVSDKGEEGENVQCGYFESNSGNSGKAVVNGAGKEFYGSKSLSTGDVYGYAGDAIAGIFSIVTRDDPGDSITTAFGKVESGLRVLREAIAEYPDITDVKIIDCGIALSL